MKTRIVSGAAGVEEAVALLRAGQVVGMPTETVYGLAGRALHPEPVTRIFEAKERPLFDPLIVHLSSLDWLDRLTNAAGSPIVQALAGRFWPGPLTLVLPRSGLVPDLVTSGLPTVALRMSAHPLFREALAQLGEPVAAPSANRFGRISPTAAAHVLEELDGRIPLILDGGPCAVGLESTVVAPVEGGLRLLRAGPISQQDLEAVAPVLPPSPGRKLESPGQLPSHYAPRAPLHLLAGQAEAEHWQGPGRTGLLAWSRTTTPAQFSAMEVLTPNHDPREAATRLFGAMRSLDGLQLDLIVAEPPPGASGLEIAILDRLRRASARERVR